MDGFKDSTRMKYMTEGGTYNERGRRATMGEIAAEDRRMSGRPSEGVSSRPTDASGRRATDAELGMTNSAKKAVGPSSVAVSKVLAGMTKPMKKATGGGVFPEGGKRAPKPYEGVRYTDGPPGSSGGLTAEYVDYMQKREEAEYQARLVASAKAKKATGVRQPSGSNTNRNDIVASKPTPVGSKPASRVSILDTIRGAVKTSPGNPLTGGSVIEKPQVSGGPVTDPRANIGNTLEIMKKQALARELPTPTPAPKGRELPTPPMMVKGQKINVPPTRGPSMSPAFNDRPMVRRKTGGLSVMPKGKC